MFSLLIRNIVSFSFYIAQQHNILLKCKMHGIYAFLNAYMTEILYLTFHIMLKL